MSDEDEIIRMVLEGDEQRARELETLRQEEKFLKEKIEKLKEEVVYIYIYSLRNVIVVLHFQ